MGSLGETLRQARLDRGATLADAERETHIRRKYLDALEAEDYGALPGTVYARGFIRIYARYLGLDPEATLDLFPQSRLREDRFTLRPATPQLSSGRPISLRLFTIIAGLALSALLVAYLWMQYNSFVESLTPAPGTSVPRTAASPVTQPGAAVSPVATKPSPATGPATAPSPTPERGLSVLIRILDRTWIEVWTDGASQMQTTLQPGAQRTFTANESIRLRVGNAGGVEATVNGEPQGPLGDRNQVKEIVWERS